MMVERSRRSVGATLAAAREARAGAASTTALSVAANLAGGTHHAFPDRGEGYCVFNDVAVAAAVLLRDGAIARVAVVDCDVHQGNGTAAIFRDEPSVFTFSMHGANNFPFRKEASDLDVTFDDGAGDDEYLAALARAPAAACSTAPAGLRLLSGRRRSLRRRSARPAQADHRRPAARAIAWSSTRAASAACRSPSR